MNPNLLSLLVTPGLLIASCAAAPAAETTAARWQVGTPIVTYWCGPTVDDRVARQMIEGGFNLVWCGEGQLDLAHRHGLRAMLTDGLLSPASLDNAEQRQKLEALIERVRQRPALYAYYIIDEPAAGQFAALGRLVSFLRERDPARLAYINLFPTYANNQQLGTQGDTVTAYREHLRQYVSVVKPALISYDHYQFRLKDDSKEYFLNLAMIRRAAQEAGTPFLNIVQACTWAPDTMRVPNTNELRYLVHTTLAYGAQGISYYVYACANHHGSLVGLDGNPGPLFHALRSYNPEFVAVAGQLQPLRSLGVYHTALKEAGCEALPPDSPFRPIPSKSSLTARGFLLGLFGSQATPSHAYVVNLDYRSEATVSLAGPDRLEVFNAANGQWAATSAAQAELKLAPGGGRLVRVVSPAK